MCGIFGIAVRAESGMTRASWEQAVRELFLLSESRGKEAAGIAIATAARIVIHKDSVSASRMMRSAAYKSTLERGIAGFFQHNGTSPDGQATLAAIGHCRLVTNGLQGIDENNQPVWHGNAIVVHNGIVVNVDQLWARQNEVKPRAEVDTEVIAALVEKYRGSQGSIDDAVRHAFADIEGETSIAMIFQDLNAMVLATNTGSLFVARKPSGQALFFASEAYICEQLARRRNGADGFADAQVEQVRAGHGAVIDLDTLEVRFFPLAPDQSGALPAISSRLGTQRVVEDKARRYAALRLGLRRCAKCVLPETMPFIAFDADGICNYCHSYTPWVRRPESELEEFLDRHRSRDGRPDCLVAFSGGRDSSYGLHLLKTKYRMTPLTFSYDWGMVTDLARRNQARMCGKLGVEHLWLSADIKMKRDNVRRNVLAWLRRPDLGIVPLFMAGDKQFFYYCNALMRQTRLDLSIWCTNRLEKTDFKTGFLGLPPSTGSFNRPASSGAGQKLNLAYQYARRFAANPALINRSLPDTLSAYFSYYVIKQDHHSFIYDYHAWETAEDTRCTWRIGDGTAPFYNYIYLTAAGFTEHDTFRSNQIREGQLTRAEALQLVAEENVPRWHSIREYAQLINIDFNDMICAVDRMPKLYDNSTSHHVH
jgi:glucosamine--fructose-6-phosphate aminotransferase (isomerizing)